MNKRNKNIIDGAAFPYSWEPELEAIIGEVTVADFQLRRLKNKLSDNFAGYIRLGGG